MIPSSVKIYVCTEPVDMRKSFDGLAQTTLDILRKDPHSGALFLFVNRRSTMLKLLWFDKGGFCILAKRLKRAVFRLPDPLAPGKKSVRIDGRELAMILEGVSLPPRMRKVA
jgi:transposase